MNITLKKILAFFDDDLLYYAGSLSFFSILALLPILALTIVLVSSLSIFNQYIDRFTLFALDILNPTDSAQLISTISGFLSNASDLGTLGLFYLTFSFVLFFRDYDHIISKIYKTKEKKFYVMFGSYISFIIIVPIFFILSLSLEIIIDRIFINFHIIQILFSFLSYWLFFIFIFKISINKKISTKSILISTMVVLISLSIFKQLFIFYTLYNSMYGTIYGSYSVLMFFFVWLYVSWLIYLYGIKLSKLLNQKLSKN